VLAVLAAFGGCSVDRQTQVTVALASETEIPKELDSFSLRVFSTKTGDLRFEQTYFPKSGRDFPTTLAVIPADEDSLESPLRIEIEGRKEGSAPFLKRQAVLSYVKGRNILLSMPLRMACFQFRDCGPNDTCVGGQCAPAQVDASLLAEFDENMVFGRPGACFEEEKCLDDRSEVIIESDCTFAIPQGEGGSVPDLETGNIAIRWDAAPSRLLALDEGDAQEGWTRDALARGRLSQGACDSHFRRTGLDGKPLVADWAKNIYFSPACRRKTGRVPYCVSPVTEHAGIGAVRPPK